MAENGQSYRIVFDIEKKKRKEKGDVLNGRFDKPSAWWASEKKDRRLKWEIYWGINLFLHEGDALYEQSNTLQQ